MLKQILAVGAIGLMLVPSSASAGSSISNGTAVAYSLTASSLLAFSCALVRGLTMDESVEEEGYDRRGWYLGASGLYARQYFEDNFEDRLEDRVDPGATLDLDDAEMGFSLRGGYRCHPRMATEIEYGLMLGDDFEGSAPITGIPVSAGDKGKVEVMMATVNTKVFALTGRTQPFALFGAGFMRTELKTRNDSLGLNIYHDTQADFALRLGGGVDFYATEDIVLNVGADYILPFGDLDDADMMVVNFGFQYRF